MKPYQRVTIANNTPESLQALERLAYNLRWSWRRETRDLFEAVDAGLWEQTDGNPVELLRRVPASRLRELSHDESFVRALAEEERELADYLERDLWYQQEHAGAEGFVAYFSMEFGITPSLPIYSGGLGVLAGDHLKSASDLGVPIVGVGLLYRDGYFAQTLSREGWQQENYTEHSPRDLPIRPVMDGDRQLHVSVSFPGDRVVDIAVWVAKVGRVSLLLLDTNLETNDHDLREITDRLYGGNEEHRIQQEIVLGVGGVRASNRFAEITGQGPIRVAHLNEGHAGFSGIERIAQRVERGESFEAALAEIRGSTVFTTHTPVPAGIDRFDTRLVRTYFDAAEDGLSRLVPGVSVEAIMALGVEADPNRFNMAHMGLRLAQRSNGVAKLHGVVSREMFADLYPNFPANETPITSITNGVHVDTWASQPMHGVIERMAGGADIATADAWRDADAVSTKELWQVRNRLRAKLVTLARERVRESWMARGAHHAELNWTRDILDPHILTVGFARRVSTYKRLTLMLQNPERLRRILLDDEHPVQFIIAGKAHPADVGGKQLMQQIVRFADEAGVRHRIVFLPDYDVGMASVLCAGADVWLNNPIRPQEASGTSGMKAVLNGALTFSVSDGWWDEARDENAGWTIPDVGDTDPETRDHLESEELYNILASEIAPQFYDRDEEGIPTAWLRKVRYSMSEVGPKVTATRMVRDYVNELYTPGLQSAAKFDGDSERAVRFVEWKHRVGAAWDAVRVDDVKVTSVNGSLVAGEDVAVEARVSLGELSGSDVAVQAIAGRIKDDEIVHPVTVEMAEHEPGVYRVEMPVNYSGEYGVNVRVVPRHEDLVSPAELGLVAEAS